MSMSCDYDHWPAPKLSKLGSNAAVMLWMASRNKPPSASKSCQMILSTKPKLFTFTVNVSDKYHLLAKHTADAESPSPPRAEKFATEAHGRLHKHQVFNSDS